MSEEAGRAIAGLTERYALSPAAADRLARLDDTFLEWAAVHNLVARSTLPERWDRHYADSLQLLALIPDAAETLIDLGTGGGFPALPLAAVLADRGVRVTMVESVAKKCAYLRAAADAMDIEAEVRTARIESLPREPFDVVTARALAPLEKLLGYAAPFFGPETVALLPKGQDVEAELTEAAKSWTYEVETRPSATSPDAAILEVRRLVSRTRDTRSASTAHPRRRQSKGRRR